MSTDTGLVGLPAIEAAAELLHGTVHVTPLTANRALSELVGGPVFLKCENLQRTGSFKIRGAYTRIARLSDQQRAAGVVAASAGNHAQGVALAASLLGARSTVFMPETAPLPKVVATADYGAEVVLCGRTVDEALVAARSFGVEHGRELIHPFDHPDVIAGQGTVGLEVLDQCPDVADVVVCTGGGGLVAGIAAAVAGRAPGVGVTAVQAAAAAAFPASLAAGHPVALESMTTIADGIAVGCPSELSYAHVSQQVTRVLTVSEESLSRALLLCLERAKLVVEPAGAAAVAALLEHPELFRPPVVAVLSGGNIDPLLLDRVLRHGLVANGRYLSLQVRIADQPGSLAGLLDVLAATGSNVLDVEHLRTRAELGLTEVEVSLQVETRGSEHSEQVQRALAAAGYHVAPGPQA